MTDEQRKSVALEYLKAFDNGGVTSSGASILDLFASDAQVYFPKWGLATGRDQIGKLFGDVGGTLKSIQHHYASFQWVFSGADVAMAGHEDIDRAVAAAEKAFPAWSRMAAADRGRILLKLADLVEANAEELARLESLDTGHPLRDSRGLDVPRTAACYRYFG